MRLDDRAGRFDDAVGPGWCIVASGTGVLAGLTAGHRAAWAAIGGRIAVLGTPGEPSSLVDGDGVYAAWFAGHLCLAAVVRPDWFLHVTAGDGQALAALLERLQASLHGGAALQTGEPVLGVGA